MQDVALSPKHKFGLTPSQLRDFEKGEKDTIPARGAFDKDPDAVDALSEQVRRAGRHRRRNHVPWASLIGFLLCAAFLVVGMQLLFGANATQDGTRWAFMAVITGFVYKVCSAAQLSQCLAEDMLPMLCAFSMLCGHVYTCLHDVVVTHTSCAQRGHRTVHGDRQTMCIAATMEFGGAGLP